MPRLQYFLRSSPAFDSSELTPLSEGIRELLSAILNIQLEDEAWAQASLPVRWGGLRVRDVIHLAATSFLSSLAATAPLVERILPQAAHSGDCPLRQAALVSWSQRGRTSPPVGEEAGR